MASATVSSVTSEVTAVVASNVATERKEHKEVSIGGIVASAPVVPPQTVSMPDFLVGQSDKLLRQLKLVTVEGSPAHTSITNMEAVLAKTELEDRKQDLKYFYDSIKVAVMKGGYEWLDASAIWTYDPTALDGVKIMINVGLIYKQALKNKEVKEVELKSQPAIAAAKAIELILPETIVLHSYRIFHVLEEDATDKQKLKAEVTAIEKRLGIIREAPPVNANTSFQMPSEAAEFMLKAPGMAMNILSDPRAGNVMAQISERLANVGNINDAIAGILNITQNQEFRSLIADKVEMAIPGTKVPRELLDASTGGTSTNTAPVSAEAKKSD